MMAARSSTTQAHDTTKTRRPQLSREFGSRLVESREMARLGGSGSGGDTVPLFVYLEIEPDVQFAEHCSHLVKWLSEPGIRHANDMRPECDTKVSVLHTSGHRFESLVDDIRTNDYDDYGNDYDDDNDNDDDDNDNDNDDMFRNRRNNRVLHVSLLRNEVRVPRHLAKRAAATVAAAARISLPNAIDRILHFEPTLEWYSSIDGKRLFAALSVASISLPALEALQRAVAAAANEMAIHASDVDALFSKEGRESTATGEPPRLHASIAMWEATRYVEPITYGKFEDTLLSDLFMEHDTIYAVPAALARRVVVVVAGERTIVDML